VAIRKYLYDLGAARAENVFPAAMLAACSTDLDGLIAAWKAGYRCHEDFWPVRWTATAPSMRGAVSEEGRA
jgi:hypothetical protein